MGRIFQSWKKKQTVALQKSFFDTLPSLPTTSKSKAVNMGFVFMMGDQLRFIGYAKTSELILGSAFIEDVPQTNEFYQFEIL